MLFDPRIHSMQQLVKSVLGRLEKMRGGLNYEGRELLVLNYHSTPKKFIAHFTEQVDFLREHYRILSPSDLDAYFKEDLHTDRASVLFTFDDGLKNNLYAAQVLDEKNIKALFFIVPAFIDTPQDEQKAFYLRNIRPVVNPRIDHETEDFCSLNWQQLSGLGKNGHAIGAHTLTHTLVASNSSLENSESEIGQCKKKIEEKLSVKVETFCSINNTLLSVGEKEKKLVQNNYRYHFTTLPGYNSVKKDPLFIKRRNVECYWPMGAFYYALGKSDLKRWQNRIEQYETL